MVDSDERILESLRIDFPHWTFGRTYDRTGRPNWWTAKRKLRLTRHQEWKNLAPTLYGDNAAELREALKVEAERESLAAATDPASWNPAYL